eukprot:Tamp_17543.p1 GENE.Tamp_17543~~Tamp_17543.p1  ORF type:complete len:371 (-),score=-0.45 Tamp_17543:210-1322(-)
MRAIPRAGKHVCVRAARIEPVRLCCDQVSSTGCSVPGGSCVTGCAVNAVPHPCQEAGYVCESLCIVRLGISILHQDCTHRCFNGGVFANGSRRLIHDEKTHDSEIDPSCCAASLSASCSSPFVYTAGSSCGSLSTNVATCCVCPANTYLDLNACIQLPDHMVSPLGSISKLDGKCTKGYMGRDGTGPCTPCAQGFYKDVLGNVSCTACPEGTDTDGTASASVSMCKRKSSCGKTCQGLAAGAGALGLLVLVACAMLACTGRRGSKFESQMPPPPPPQVLPLVSAQFVEISSLPQRAIVMAAQPPVVSMHPASMPRMSASPSISIPTPINTFEGPGRVFNQSRYYEPVAERERPLFIQSGYYEPITELGRP